MHDITTRKNIQGQELIARKVLQPGTACAGSTFPSPKDTKSPLHCSKELKVQATLTWIRQQLLQCQRSPCQTSGGKSSAAAFMISAQWKSHSVISRARSQMIAACHRLARAPPFWSGSAGTAPPALRRNVWQSAPGNHQDTCPCSLGWAVP